MERSSISSKLTRLIAAVGLSLYLTVGGVGAALADTTPTPDPTVTPTPVTTPAPDPTPSAAPDATSTPSSTADPTVTPTPVATPAPDPTPSNPTDTAATPSPAIAAPESASPTVTPSASPKTDATAKSSTTGPGTCTGVVPSWVFDTVKQLWVASDKTSFVCDMPSGLYLSPKYFYNTRTGWYVILAPDAPVTKELVTAPNIIHTVLGDITVGSKDYQMAQALGLLKSGPDGIVTTPGSSSVTTSGAGGTAATNYSSSGQTWLDLTNLVTVINTLDSAAKTGNVAGSANTTVGDMSSGTANVIANLINLLSAAWSWANGDLSFFMQNFFGNQSGNVLLDPTQTVTGSGGQLGTTTNNSNALNVNAKSSGSIVNNIDLTAQSGGVAADSNTTAGNVTSGSATATVNILNLINSLINSGNSFFGILNIFGSLTGNVLFPNGFFDGLIPSSAAPIAAPTASGPGSVSDTTVTNTNTANINNTVANSAANNITTTAQSGSVGAGGNTFLGSAASGAATTTQSLFNLANTSLFGDNAVLVIVNVLGHWVGKIMNLPGGGSTSSALLTSNAQTSQIPVPNATGPDSTATSTTTNTNTANINQTAVGTITNNVNVGAKSGDVTATNNTTVGNVSSGIASAASSVANIFNSVLNVKHWFGVLVINVFGDWFGNVDTAKPQVQVPAAATAQVDPAVLVPQLSTLKNFTTQPTSTVAATPNGTVAGAEVAAPQVVIASAKSVDEAVSLAKGNGMNFLFALSAFVMLIAGALLAVERKISSGTKL